MTQVIWVLAGECVMRCDTMISWVGTAMGVKNILIWCDAVMPCPVCQKPEVMCIYLQINTRDLYYIL